MCALQSKRQYYLQSHMYSGKPGMKFWEATTLQHDCSSLNRLPYSFFFDNSRSPLQGYFSIPPY